MRAFNAERQSLAVDAFHGGALAIDLLVGVTLPIEGVSQPGANAGGDEPPVETPPEAAPECSPHTWG